MFLALVVGGVALLGHDGHWDGSLCMVTVGWAAFVPGLINKIYGVFSLLFKKRLTFNWTKLN